MDLPRCASCSRLLDVVDLSILDIDGGPRQLRCVECQLEWERSRRDHPAGKG